MRHTVALLLCLIVAQASAGVWADMPSYRAEPAADYLREWLVCGPFPLAPPGQSPDGRRLPGMFRDYLQPIGGETSPQITEGQTVPLEDGSVNVWVRHVTPFDYVDLDAAVSEQETGVAYAYLEIEASDDTPSILAFGSNDGARVWINGEEVLTRPGPRGLKLDGDMIPVLLRRGRNTLLVKVEERGNLWRMAARFLPLDSGALRDRFKLFEVVRRNDGAAMLRVAHSTDVLRVLTRHISLEAADVSAPDRVLWRGEWSGERDTPIGVDRENYREYVLRAKLDMKGGAEEMVEIPFKAGRRIEHILFADGATDYSIVVCRDASESEKWAAQELRHWLKEVGGADFPVLEGTSSRPAKAIYIGFDPSLSDLIAQCPGANSRRPAPGDESFRYVNAGPNILIWGGRDRGTMYGVMSFLEREMGVRFYTPRVAVTPKKARYLFTHLNHGEQPGIRVRNDFYYEAFEPVWAARNRVNGAMTWREQPGGLECYWAVHTFFPLMPPEEFFESHPEYYSLVNGKRQYDRAQLCLTNPDVLRIVTERIKQKIRELPQYLIYDVSQNDWGNPCQCDACQAIAKEEGSESGVVIWFVNQVADAIKEEFPDKFIGTLAYQYTRKPPKTQIPRENVVVRLCSIECCFAHDFLSCPENESFVEDMQGWAKMAPHLYIWDYVVNFSHYIMPYPNFRVLQPNIQFFRDHKAIGIMEQAAYQSRGGEFAELRAYLISKLLWDPEIDVPTVIDDFMYGYYGRAGQHVKAYFDLLHNQITPDTHIHLGLAPDDKIFSDDFVRRAEALFDQAEIVADTEDIRQRVEMARLPVMYLKCRRTPIEAKQDGTYSRFKEIVAREGITHYAESGASDRQGFHEFMDSVEVE